MTQQVLVRHRSRTRASSAPAVRRVRARKGHAAAVLVAPYVLLLLVGGLIPTGYAVVKSLQNEAETGFGGLSSYQRVAGDFRFVETFANVALVLCVWMPLLLTAAVVLALLVDASPRRFGASMRFVYYLPGAFAGIANFMLWLFLLNPGQSPVDFLWHGFGYTSLNEVAQPGNLPFIIAAMLFFQGTGTWVVVLCGGLNGIPDELLEAAKMDGATAWGVVWSVKIPMIRPWLGYMTLLNLAYGFQLFLEPQVLGQVTHGLISPQWTPNQLSFTYAYQILDTPAAAAMSVILLLVTLGLGLLVVHRSRLFQDER
ncbi:MULTISPECIES: carbohydrate ABC transporter permease [Catellatospora]|uniref:Sugar ABC transporter permease n=1 Tax=Catellatospora chokoriensis TaxID=310353 RepID=A0A8J3JMH0_9ACTN|nr:MULTISPECIES: sugar ABC transporter permease [Catellatospora]RKE05667.1 carbohydrate ABC transporter membrane protein 1 (CUT1 family) [Catellatospora citrea]GIF87696.1 sugar ABC transporter permease [Catellatospora chokoriensis]